MGDGLKFVLSEGRAEPEERVQAPQADAQPISAELAARLLARLPDLPARPDDRQDFAPRADSAPPPPAGATIQQSFPPHDELLPPPNPPTGPLAILGYAPEDDVALAAQLSLTVSQPMA